MVCVVCGWECIDTDRVGIGGPHRIEIVLQRAGTHCENAVPLDHGIDGPKRMNTGCARPHQLPRRTDAGGVGATKHPKSQRHTNPWYTIGNGWLGTIRSDELGVGRHVRPRTTPIR